MLFTVANTAQALFVCPFQVLLVFGHHQLSVKVNHHTSGLNLVNEFNLLSHFSYLLLFSFLYLYYITLGAVCQPPFLFFLHPDASAEIGADFADVLASSPQLRYLFS
jgi:hypothetical protein